jgi:hypothetical protein
MCRPSCCPGDNGSGLGAALAVLVGILVISAVARPIIHAAEILLQVILITLAVLAGLAILTAVTVLVIRYRRGSRASAIALTRIRLASASHFQRATGPSLTELNQRVQVAEATANAALIALAHLHRTGHLPRLPERKEAGHAGQDLQP